MENKSQKVICQNCKHEFLVEAEDFLFYEKIKVPAPTWCPTCRSVRRMASTNERALYKRKCDFTGADIFSMYDNDATFPVYETSKWYSDEWDPYQYGTDYDFSRPFFEQFLELRNKVPRMSLVRQGFSINSEYTHRVTDMKNSYMVFRSTNSLDSMYIYMSKDITDCLDCFAISQNDLCYECIDCNKCYKVKFSQESVECRDSMFLYACVNCSDCVSCVNLRNQQYCIFNKKYSKEEYLQKVKDMELNTFSGLEKMKTEFDSFRKKFPQRSSMSIKSNNTSGNWFTNCENVKNSFWCLNVKDCKNGYFIFNAEDCMDYFQWGNNSELIYESENCGLNSSSLFFCTQCWTGAHHLFYCDSCPSSSNCFGCIGLKKGEYSILNKKYNKEEYEKLVPKIIKHMNEMPYVDRGLIYKFGEHFPESLSSFKYNETAANDFYTLSKQDAISGGYGWKEREKRNYQITKKSFDLPEKINEVGDEILGEIIECASKDDINSPGAFRITKNELSFYRRMDLPLPRVSFDVRHMNRLKKRPPLRTIKRNCSKCDVEVDTVYDEEYAPILYCEKCYQQEVY
jgi:hypothetical protein